MYFYKRTHQSRPDYKANFKSFTVNFISNFSYPKLDTYKSTIFIN